MMKVEPGEFAFPISAEVFKDQMEKLNTGMPVLLYVAAMLMPTHLEMLALREDKPQRYMRREVARQALQDAQALIELYNEQHDKRPDP